MINTEYSKVLVKCYLSVVVSPPIGGYLSFLLLRLLFSLIFLLHMEERLFIECESSNGPLDSRLSAHLLFLIVKLVSPFKGLGVPPACRLVKRGDVYYPKGGMCYRERVLTYRTRTPPRLAFSSLE